MTIHSRSIEAEELLANMGWVQSLARSLVHDESLAKDVAQSTWLQALTRPPRSVEGPGLRAWLATVTRTMARQHLRAERRRSVRQQAAARPEADSASVDVVERGALQSRVVDLVMSLDEPFRSTLLLRYLDELSFAEIAKLQSRGAVSVSESAVRKRVSRGLASVRARLEADDREWSCALIALAGPAKAGAGLSALTIGGILMTQRWAVLGVVLLVGSISAWLFGDSLFASNRPADRADSLGVSVLSEPAREAGDSSASASAREAVARRVTLKVMTAEGSFVSGAVAILLAEGQIVEQSVSDDEGGVSFAAGRGTRSVIVAVKGRVPERFEFDESAERLVLARRSEVSGRVVIRGPESDRSMNLVLVADRPWSVFAELSGTVRERLAQLSIYPDRLSLDVGDLAQGDPTQGEFVFAGIPQDWTGRIAVPEHYVYVRVRRLVAEDANHVFIPTPQHGLELEVARLPVIHGHLIRADDQTAVVGARVTAIAMLKGLRSPLRGLEVTGPKGEFRVILAGESRRIGDQNWAARDLLRFELSVQLARSVREFDLAVTLDALAVDVDLGELPMTLAPPSRIQVEDEAGEPIAGAVASTRAGRSTPADATGQAVFSVSPGDGSEITVVAPGFANTAATLTGSDTRVVMKPTAVLSVKIVGVEASIVSDLRLHVSQPGKRRLFGLMNSDISFVKVPDQNGLVSLTGLPTDKKTTLTLSGRFGTRLGQMIVEPLRGTEPRLVEFRPTTDLFSLRGQVVDDRGRPLPRVLVNILLAGEGDMTRSDADGKFSFDGLSQAGKTATLVVERRGFMAERLADVELSPGMAPLRVTLLRGRAISVVVRDESGRPVAAVMAIAQMAGRAAVATTGVDGRAKLIGLPLAKGTIEVVIGGKSIAVEVGADQLEAEIVIPVLGKVQVIAVIHRPVKQICRLTITPLDEPSQESYVFLRGRNPRRGERLLALIPGEYRAILETWNQPKSKERLGEPKTVSIRGDETVELKIELR